VLNWVPDETGDLSTHVHIDGIRCRLGFSSKLKILALCILDLVPDEAQYEQMLQLNQPLSARKINLSLEGKKVVLIQRDVTQTSDEVVHSLLEVAKRCVAMLIGEEIRTRQ
jgi:hypothetical protein